MFYLRRWWHRSWKTRYVLRWAGTGIVMLCPFATLFLFASPFTAKAPISPTTPDFVDEESSLQFAFEGNSIDYRILAANQDGEAAPKKKEYRVLEGDEGVVEAVNSSEGCEHRENHARLMTSSIQSNILRTQGPQSSLLFGRGDMSKLVHEEVVD